MIFIRTLVAVTLLLTASSGMTQQPEIHFGAPGRGMPPKPQSENYLAKCIANPNDRISCHLAHNAERDGGLEFNYVRGDVAPSAYVICNKAGGVCRLELATLKLDESEPTQPRQQSILTSIDISILFHYDQASIRASEIGKLKQLAIALQTNGNVNTSFAVIGHTDARGTDAYNCKLSRRRAEAVVQRLSMLGVPAAKLHAIGAGKKLLRDTQNGEAAINRRVGFARMTDDSKTVTSKLFALCKS